MIMTKIPKSGKRTLGLIPLVIFIRFLLIISRLMSKTEFTIAN